MELKVINKSLIYDLITTFHTEPFTLKQAYEIYRKSHIKKPYSYWSEMNVRNTLSTAVQYNLCERVGKGVYKFNYDWVSWREYYEEMR